MRIIHGAGYTDKDRAEFKELVYKNVYTAIRILVEAMRALEISYASPANEVLPTLFSPLRRCEFSHCPLLRLLVLSLRTYPKRTQSA